MRNRHYIQTAHYTGHTSRLSFLTPLCLSTASKAITAPDSIVLTTLLKRLLYFAHTFKQQSASQEVRRFDRYSEQTCNYYLRVLFESLSLFIRERFVL